MMDPKHRRTPSNSATKKVSSLSGTPKAAGSYANLQAMMKSPTNTPIVISKSVKNLHSRVAVPVEPKMSIDP